MSHLRLVSYNLVIVLTALVAGIAIGFGALWYAFETEFFTSTHHRLLIVAAIGCLVAGALPWPKKRPIPEGLAE